MLEQLAYQMMSLLEQHHLPLILPKYTSGILPLTTTLEPPKVSEVIIRQLHQGSLELGIIPQKTDLVSFIEIFEPFFAEARSHRSRLLDEHKKTGSLFPFSFPYETKLFPIKEVIVDIAAIEEKKRQYQQSKREQEEAKTKELHLVPLGNLEKNDDNNTLHKPRRFTANADAEAA